jgi:hypothetical protein
MQDWDISVHYVKQDDIPGNLGECDAEPTNRTGNIDIADPADKPHDVELTLVHEMLHLLTWWTRINGARSHRNTVGEQSIEAIASALVTLKRCGRK